MSNPPISRKVRLAATYVLELGSIWADAADDLTIGIHQLLHYTAITLERAATRMDPDT